MTTASATAQSPHEAQLSFSVSDDQPHLAATVTITQEQVEFFHHNGFLHVNNLAPLDEITQLTKDYDRWFADRVGHQHGNFFDLVGEDDDPNVQIIPQMLWPSQYGYPLYTTQFYANAYAISHQLLGPSSTFKGDHAICKPVSSRSVPTPWHQDESYWNPNIAYEALGVWIALQPVDLQSGCMRFLSGSHRISSSPVPHRTIGNNPKIHALEIEDQQLTDIAGLYSVAVPLPTGGATFHHCRTLHYTGPNHGNIPRRAYTLSFQGKTQTLQTPRNYHWNQSKQTNRQRRQEESGWTGREP